MCLASPQWPTGRTGRDPRPPYLLAILAGGCPLLGRAALVPPGAALDGARFGVRRAGRQCAAGITGLSPGAPYRASGRARTSGGSGFGYGAGLPGRACRAAGLGGRHAGRSRLTCVAGGDPWPIDGAGACRGAGLGDAASLPGRA